MIIKGKLIKCNETTKTFKGKETPLTTFITLAEVDFSDKELTKYFDEVYKDAGKSFQPNWYKHPEEGYFNTKTQFELPCIGWDNEHYDSVLDYIADNANWVGAEVGISLKAKANTVYPQSIKFYGEGKEIDPYAEFDEE